MQGHQLQMLQQQQLPSVHAHYQAQQQELSQSRQQLVEHAQPHVIHQQGDVSSQQQQDLGMSLQEYFKDPKAITVPAFYSQGTWFMVLKCTCFISP
jgi:hypothetical protein